MTCEFEACSICDVIKGTKFFPAFSNFDLVSIFIIETESTCDNMVKRTHEFYIGVGNFGQEMAKIVLENLHK
jgi:hypothetical protein